MEAVWRFFVSQVLPTFITSAFLTGVILWAFKTYAGSWISNRFAIELERFRLETSTLLSRTKILYDKEFEIIPEAWARLVEANSALISYTASFKAYTSIVQMSDQNLTDFLTSMDFGNAQVRMILELPRVDRQTAYGRVLAAREAETCRLKLLDFENYVEKYGIFVSEELSASLTKVSGLMWQTWIICRPGFEPDDPNEAYKQTEHYRDTAPKEIASVQEQVRARMWSRRIWEMSGIPGKDVEGDVGQYHRPTTFDGGRK